MKSVALHHFPRIVAESNRFLLFNPILRKRYENRPEERVRLKWVEYLLLQTDWKKTRIGFESPVKIRQIENTLRADLVLYYDSMKPSILIECKAESVKLNQSVAEQAARYNSEVKANYLVLTNGIEDYWFKQEESDIQPSENILNVQSSKRSQKRDFKYWSQRGFCSSKCDSELKDWLPETLDLFWSDAKNQRQYLDFKQTVLPVPMNHYYKICDIDDDRRLAISFIGHEGSDNYLIGILNSGGMNQGIVSVNLNKMNQDDKDAITVFKEGRSKTLSSVQNFSIDFTEFNPDQVENLPQTLINFFD